MIVYLAVLLWRDRNRHVKAALEQAANVPVPPVDLPATEPEPADGEAVEAQPPGWQVPFECDTCGAKNRPAAVGPNVELICWAGELNPRFRWVLRLWCDNCPAATIRPLSVPTADLWRLAFDVHVHNEYTPTVSDNVVAALIESGDQ